MKERQDSYFPTERVEMVENYWCGVVIGWVLTVGFAAAVDNIFCCRFL